MSVIIPTHDRLALLKEAIDSVTGQTLSSCEAVVVDDASSDGTAEWLAEREGERLAAVVLDEHVERAVARNRGLERARGHFVLFLDDDDKLRPSALERLHSALVRHPAAIAAVGGRALFDERGNRRTLAHPRRPLMRRVWADLVAGWMTPPGTVLWRTEVVRGVGAWAENILFSEDRELLVRASRLGPMVLLPDVVLDKRAHAGQRRARDARRIHAEWMRRHLESLPPRDRRVGFRLSRTYRYLNDARIAYGNLRSREAVSLYIRAVRTTPSVLGSPLVRPAIGRGLAKSLVGVVIGKRAVLLARRVKGLTLMRLGRDIVEDKPTEERDKMVGPH